MKKSIAALAAALLGTLTTHAPAQVKPDETVKIGVLVSYSGIGMLGGIQTDNVIKQFQARFGAAPGGKKIEFVRRTPPAPIPRLPGAWRRS